MRTRADYEIEAARNEETRLALLCRMMDFCAFEMMSMPDLNDKDRVALFMAAMRRFAPEKVNDDLIYRVVARMIQVELGRRKTIAALPKPQKRNRFGRVICAGVQSQVGQ